MSKRLNKPAYVGQWRSLETGIVKAILSGQKAFLWMIERLSVHQRKAPTVPRTILLLRISALGDFIFSVPAMVVLREQNPNAKIILLTATTTSVVQSAKVQAYAGPAPFPWLTFVVPSVVDEAICIQSFNFKRLWTEIRPRVKKLNPDVTVVLSHPGEPGLGLLKKMIFLRLVGARNEIYGWRTRASNKWLRKVQYDAGLFEHHVFGPLRSIAELPGMPPIGKMEIKFPLHIDEDARIWADEFLQTKKWGGYKIVAVAPGSVQPHKAWPIDRFEKLCQELVQRFKVRIIVIGTKSDTFLGNKLARAFDCNIVNLAGETTLSQSAALLARCALLVGNDGGAIHLGSAMGCPSVSIVPGIEYPGSIEPWFSRDIAVRHSVSCAPCYSFTRCPYSHNKCMKELPLEKVLDNCVSVLD